MLKAKKHHLIETSYEAMYNTKTPISHVQYQKYVEQL